MQHEGGLVTQLEALLQQCTVKLSVAGGWGTGFFVAPGLILTCEHVVKHVGNCSIQVRWQHQENWAEAVVERSPPDPYDLALLRVTTPTEINPPCVYLDAAIESRDPLYLFGYPDQDFPNGCPVTFSCEGLTGDEPPLIKFALGQVRPGMSGSPLLNQRTGKVCGIVKFTRDRSIDLGGGAVPTAVILECFPEVREYQEQFHSRDRCWSVLAAPRSPAITLDEASVSHRAQAIDFKPYLNSLIQHYEQWWNDALTATIAARQATFTFEQRVQTEEKDQFADSDRRQKTRTIQLPLISGIQEYAKTGPVLVIGSPGVGKSAALLRCLVEYAKQELAKPEPQRIPVLIRLKGHNKQLASADDRSGLIAMIQDALEPELSLKIAEIKKLLFQETRLILLLDGLNEMSSDSIRTELIGFEEKCARAKIPFICSTRELGSGDLGIKRRLVIQPPAPEEIDRFLHECIPHQFQKVEQLLNRDRRELSRTPFVLWMLYHVIQETGDVADTLGEAFRQFFEAFKGRNEAAPVTNDRRKAWDRWLRHLAFTMLSSPEPTDPGLVISEEDAEKALFEEFSAPHEPPSLSELLKYHLLQQEKNEISFSHQLIQEYYAAEALLLKLRKLTGGELKCNYLNYLKWTEPSALMLALLEDEEKALQIVRWALDVDLMFGARLAGEVKAELQEQATESVMERSANAVPEQPDWLKLKLLKTIGSKVVADQLVFFLSHIDHRIGDDAYFTLLVIAPEAIPKGSKHQENAKWIRQILETSPDNFEKKELLSLDPHILEQLAPDVRSIFDAWLAKTQNSDEVIAALAPMLHLADSEIQWSVVKVLGCLKNQASIPILLQALENPQSLVAYDAAIELGKLKDKSVVPKLIEIFERSSNSKIRLNIIHALRIIGSEEIIPAIFQGIYDSDIWVCRAASEAFDNIDSEAIVPGLIETISHPDLYVCRLAACRIRSLSVKENISNLLNKEYIQILIQGLEYSDIWVRWRIALTLWNIAAEGVIPFLYSKLNHSNFDISLCAALVLGKFGCKDALPGLVQIMKSDNLVNHPDLYEIQTTAAYALMQVKDEVVTEYLPELRSLISTQVGEKVLRAIVGIQANCQFYDYEIYQSGADEAGTAR